MEGLILQSVSQSPFLTLGTRGSPLARIQAEQVRRLLADAHDCPPEEIAIKIISTAGDRSQASNRSLAEIGGKGLFSNEIEVELLNGAVDIAVHSAKDMATQLPDELIMPFFLQREDVRDVFISFRAKSLEEMPDGAIIGTSSLRRRAQIANIRPDLRLIEFRGNVGTRLQKLTDGLADATLLAAAGLLRTGLANKITSFLPTSQFPPAPAQGAIGLELRANDTRTHALAAPLNHLQTACAVQAERAMLAMLDGSCRTPIAALSTWKGEKLTLFGQILSTDGQQKFETSLTDSASNAELLGKTVGQQLLKTAGPEFMAKLQVAT